MSDLEFKVCKKILENPVINLINKYATDKDIRSTKQDAANKALKNGWRIVDKDTHPPSISSIRSVVKNAATQILGVKENVDVTVDILMGQLGMETGFKSLHNNNVGNLMAAGSPNQYWKGDVIVLLAHEFDKQKNKYYLNSLFRSYDSLENGVYDWATLLKTRYPLAIEKASKGDIEGFVVELKKKGYFTAPVESYMAGVKSWSKKDKIKSDTTQQNKTTLKPSSPATENDLEKLLNEYDVGSKLVNPQKLPITKPQTKTPANDNSSIDSLLESFVGMIRAAGKKYSKQYKKYLPTHNFVIQVFSNDKTDAIEFGRILCSALDEELMAKAYVHTNNDNIEIQCDIQGPKQLCFEAVKQLTESIADAFKSATIKLGGINIKANVIMNKKSSYSELTIKSALSNYRKFLLKFV